MSPSHQQRCSVRDQSRIGAHTAPQSRLWSRLTAGALFWNFVRLMSRSGTDSPYRPSPNEERCNRLVPHSEPSPRSSMRFSSETVREPSMSSYLLRGIPRTSSAIWRVLDKGYTLRSFKLLRNPALNPNQGRRVVSPTGATAVPTPLFARLSRVSPPLIIWPRAILEPPFNCRKSRRGPGVEWTRARAPFMGFHWKPPGQRATISVATPTEPHGCGRSDIAAREPGGGRPASARRSRRSAEPGAASYMVARRRDRPRSRAALGSQRQPERAMPEPEATPWCLSPSPPTIRFLPLNAVGDVRHNWQSAGAATSKIPHGRALMAPADLAASLVDKGQARMGA